MESENNRGSIGPVVATIIILILIIIGGLYFWGARVKNVNTAAAGQAATSSDVEAIQNQSSSDDAGSIQADLNNTNVDSVDAGLKSQ